MDNLEVFVVAVAVAGIMFIAADAAKCRVSARYWSILCLLPFIAAAYVELDTASNPQCVKNGGVMLRSTWRFYQCYEAKSLRPLQIVAATPSRPR